MRLPRRPRAATVVVAFVAVGFVGVSVHEAWTDGPTFDEGTYLVSGLTALRRHDLRINPQHPPLGKVLAAAPLLAGGAADPPAVPGGARAWRRANEYGLAGAWIREERAAGRLQRTLFLGRLVPIAEGLAAGWLIWLLARDLFGQRAAPFAAVLWLANPFTIGLAHLDGIDLPGTVTVLAVVLLTVRAVRGPTWPALVWLGVVGGAAVLTRTTGLLALAAAIAVVVVRSRPAGLRLAVLRGATVAGVAWLTLAVVYAALAPRQVLPRSGDVLVLGSIARFALPPDWLRGMGHLFRAGSDPGPSYLLGQSHVGRWPWFWFGSLAVKLPPITTLLLFVGPLSWLALDRQRRRDALWFLGPSTLLIAVFTLQQQRPIGLRYLLPVIALGIVGASAVATLARPVRVTAWATALPVGVACALALPSLSWTLPVFGPGYRVAADSNLDWGQSWPELVRWSRQHHPWVAHFGGAGTDVTDLPGARDLAHARGPVRGWVAVSATALTVYEREDRAWLRAYCPVGVLDRTILLYRFSTPPDRSLSGPDAPAPTCDRGPSSLTAQPVAAASR